MKVLHLTLKKKWFDMIASGEKKEEYRELKPYWFQRLGYWHDSDHETGYYDSGFNKMPDVILFKNGYTKESPSISVCCEEIVIGTGNPDWGAEQGKKYFVIKLSSQINPPSSTKQRDEMTHLKEGLHKEIVLLKESAHLNLHIEGNKIMWGTRRHGYFTKELPPGNWQLIGLCSEVSEEVARGIVTPHKYADGKYADNRIDEFDNEIVNEFLNAHIWYNTALESFQSLLKHHSLNPNSTVLLIKK